MLELNVWIVYDADGNVAFHAESPEEAMEAYDNDIGGHAVRRCVKVTLHAPAPQVMSMAGEVPAETADGTLTVS